MRSAPEQSTSPGAIASRSRCSAIRAAALRPRGASGRSWSARSGSSQLDFAWRRTCRCFTQPILPRTGLRPRRRQTLSGPNTRSVPELADSRGPPFALPHAFGGRSPSVLGVILEGLVTLLGDWHDRYPGVAVAAGLLIAALAGARRRSLERPRGRGRRLDAPLLLRRRPVAARPDRAPGLARRRRARRVARHDPPPHRLDASSLVSGELAAVRDSASEAIVGIDLKGTIVSWSAGAEAIYGYEPEEAVGEPISLLAHEADSERPCAPRSPRNSASGSTSPAPSTGTRTAAISPSRSRSRRSRARPVSRPAPSSSRATSASRSAPRPGSARARRSTAPSPSICRRSRTSTRSASGGLRSTSAPRSARCSATRPTNGSRSRTSSSSSSTQDDRERVSAEIAAAAAGARPLRCEYRMLSRDGRVVWVHDEAVTVRDDDGRPLYVQGYLLDVSERRHAGEERERLLAAERAAAAEALDRQRKLDILARAGEILGSTRQLPGRASPGRRPGSARAGRLVRRRPAGRRRHGAPGSLPRTPAPGLPPGHEPGPTTEPEILEVATHGTPGALGVAHVRPHARPAAASLGALTLHLARARPVLRRRRPRRRAGSRRHGRACDRQRPPARARWRSPPTPRGCSPTSPTASSSSTRRARSASGTRPRRRSPASPATR